MSGLGWPARTTEHMLVGDACGFRRGLDVGDVALHGLVAAIFTGPTHTTGLIYLMQLAYELPDFLAFGKFSHLCAGARLRLRQEPRLASVG